MVVLLRAFTHLDAYEDSLERAGLRPYVVGGRGYWSQQQVDDVCALLATIANPLDDEALFGALASPACGVAPDTLWLLRAARRAGGATSGRVERAGRGRRGRARRAASGSTQIPAAERELLRALRARRSPALRERAPRLPLAGLIDAAVDRDRLRPGGADAPRRRGALRQRAQADAAGREFEAREGRDLRGLLDFLAAARRGRRRRRRRRPRSRATTGSGS